MQPLNQHRRQILLARRLLLIFSAASVVLLCCLSPPRADSPDILVGERYDALNDDAFNQMGKGDLSKTTYVASMKAEDYHTPQVFHPPPQINRRVQKDENFAQEDAGAGVHLFRQRDHYGDDLEGSDDEMEPKRWGHDNQQGGVDQLNPAPKHRNAPSEENEQAVTGPFAQRDQDPSATYMISFPKWNHTKEWESHLLRRRRGAIMQQIYQKAIEKANEWKSIADSRARSKGRERGKVRFYDKKKRFGILDRMWASDYGEQEMSSDGLRTGTKHFDGMSKNNVSRKAKSDGRSNKPGIYFRGDNKRRDPHYLLASLTEGEEVYFSLTPKRSARKNKYGAKEDRILPGAHLDNYRDYYADDIVRCPTSRFHPLSEQHLVYNCMKDSLGPYWFAVEEWNEDQLTFDDVRNYTAMQTRQFADEITDYCNQIERKFGSGRYIDSIIDENIPLSLEEKLLQRRERAAEEREKDNLQSERNKRILAADRERKQEESEKLSRENEPQKPSSENGVNGHHNAENWNPDLERSETSSADQIGNHQHVKPRFLSKVRHKHHGIDFEDLSDEMVEAAKEYGPEWQEKIETSDKFLNLSLSESRWPSKVPPSDLADNQFFDEFETDEEVSIYPVPRLGYRVHVMTKKGWKFGEIVSLGDMNIVKSKLLGDSNDCLKWPITVRFDDGSKGLYAYPCESNGVRLGGRLLEGEEDEYKEAHSQVKVQTQPGRKKRATFAKQLKPPRVWSSEEEDSFRMDTDGSENSKQSGERSSTKSMLHEDNSDCTEDAERRAHRKRKGTKTPCIWKGKGTPPASALMLYDNGKVGYKVRQRNLDEVLASSSEEKDEVGYIPEGTDLTELKIPGYDVRQHGTLYLAPRVRRAVRKALPYLPPLRQNPLDTNQILNRVLGFSDEHPFVPWEHTRPTRFRLGILTEAEAGLGFALATKLIAVEHSSTLLVCAKSYERAKRACESLNSNSLADAIPFELNFSSKSSIDALVQHIRKEYSSCDFLIHCAGLTPEKVAERPTKVMTRNFHGPLHLTKELAKLMRPNGTIVNLLPPAAIHALRQTKPNIVKSLMESNLSVDALETIARDYAQKAEANSHVSEGYPESVFSGSKMLMLPFTRIFAAELRKNFTSLTVSSCLPDQVSADLLGNVTSRALALERDRQMVTTAFLLTERLKPWRKLYLDARSTPLQKALALSNLTFVSGGFWFNQRRVL